MIWQFTNVPSTAAAAEEHGYEVQPLRVDDARERYFIDSLTISGEVYLIPASRRMEWDAFDIQCEETCEELPVPEWAKPIGELSHLEFENPQAIFE